ncbi:hypothetical protein ACG7TL_006169 [Trametes sanguinea]
MRILTRKQHLLAAQSVPLQAGKRVLCPKDLEVLHSLVNLNPALGAFVDSLEVAIRSAFALATLRKTLQALHNLTDFVLILPTLRCPTLLRGIRLPFLEYFRTNLPHSTILEFLDAHPSIADLDLALRAISPPLSQLYQLTIEIRDDDYDILQAIACACPGVRKLKLVEHGSKAVGPRIRRRAWSDENQWAGALWKLPELEELLLRTEAPLVRRAADVALERELVLSWVHSGRRTSRRTRVRPHPMIYHVGIWYGAGKYGGGCITHWSKPSGTWERQVSILDPPAGHPFI